ncbi:MAG: ABC transporter permease [Gemmatimonadota bacterium]
MNGILSLFRSTRLRQLIRKEWLQMFRDPRLTRVIFVSPIVQLLVFGYAVNTDIRHTSTILLDRDRTQASRGLADALTASGYFRIIRQAADPRELTRALDGGEVVMGMEIPVGFARDLTTGRGAQVQIIVDGTRSNTANVARGYAERIVQQYGAGRAAALAGVDAVPAGLDFRARIWYNPDLASRVYNVPAVAGVIILLMSLLLTSLAVVRERELGTLEQLMVTPLTPLEMILGKTIPVAAIGLIDLTLITGVALFWFDIPMRGSFPLLLFASLLYILTGLGLGLLISTVSNTQQEAFMTMFLVFLPAMLLSGFMFPISSMPKVVQWATLLNPIRWFLDVVRGIFLKGAGWNTLWPELLVLAAMATLFLGLAAGRFRKRVG